MDLAMAASSSHLQMLPPGDKVAHVARLPTAAVVATMEAVVVGPQTMAGVEVKKGDKTLKPIDQSFKCVANLVTLLSSAGIISMKRTRKRRLLISLSLRIRQRRRLSTAANVKAAFTPWCHQKSPTINKPMELLAFP